MFLLTVTLIRTAVYNFSYDYIKDQKFFKRFHILLLLFIISIILIIFSGNIFFSLLGWDGLGVTSYLLVIYYGRDKSFNAGILTALVNRLGDIFFIICVYLAWSLGGWLFLIYKDFMILDFWFIITLTITAFTKRAQIPFRAWLPAAIAAPTPVSALVHSSTLVTAGVYLLMRNFENFNSFPIKLFIFFSGISTIIIARLSALNEKDIKKIVALSTLRQLGLIIIRLGLAWAIMAFYHLVIHAFFKAILFIRCGRLIHIRRRYQRIKKRGGQVFNAPLRRARTIIAVLCLTGAPFAAAFFSKEPIIELTILVYSRSLSIAIRISSIFFTVFYRYRFLFLTLRSIFKRERVSFTYEENFTFIKRQLLLFIPSFLRGRSIRRGVREPLVFYYSGVVKRTILIILPISFIIIRACKFSNLKIGEKTVFRM